jgi:hypothetical protein
VPSASHVLSHACTGPLAAIAVFIQSAGLCFTCHTVLTLGLEWCQQVRIAVAPQTCCIGIMLSDLLLNIKPRCLCPPLSLL